MTQGTPNVERIAFPAGLRLLENVTRLTAAGAATRAGLRPPLSGPQPKLSRLWDFADFDQAFHSPSRSTCSWLAWRTGAAPGARRIRVPSSRALHDRNSLAQSKSKPDGYLSMRRRSDGNRYGQLELGPRITRLPGIRRRTTVFSGIASSRGQSAGASGRSPPNRRQVAAYLAERIEEHGHKPATLRAAAAAIAFFHRTAGQDDPCASPEVKRTLRSATRKVGMRQKAGGRRSQPRGLAAIRSTACRPSTRAGREIRRVRRPQDAGETWTSR